MCPNAHVEGNDHNNSLAAELLLLLLVTNLLILKQATDLSPERAKPKYMCQPLVAKAKTSWFSMPLMLPMMEMTQSWTWR